MVCLSSIKMNFVIKTSKQVNLFLKPSLQILLLAIITTIWYTQPVKQTHNAANLPGMVFYSPTTNTVLKFDYKYVLCCRWSAWPKDASAYMLDELHLPYTLSGNTGGNIDGKPFVILNNPEKESPIKLHYNGVDYYLNRYLTDMAK